MKKFLLRDKKVALMIVDIQEKLAPAIHQSEKMEKPMSVLIEVAKQFDLPIVITEQYPKGLGKTVPSIMENLPEDNVFVYEKTEFNALLPEVLALLQEKQIETVIVTGMETHICVYQTVRELLINGIEVIAVLDALGSRTKENKKNGLSLLESMGAVISNSETIAFDFLKDAKHPAFKTISQLVK